MTIEVRDAGDVRLGIDFLIVYLNHKWQGIATLSVSILIIWISLAVEAKR